jgi:hypothetical protein
MPISRAPFQIKMPDADDLAAAQPGDLEGASQQPGHGDSNPPAQQNPPETPSQSLPNLPPADAPSAGTQDTIGPSHPKTEAPRSVATGRDAPQAPQIQLIERRLQNQKSATAEHLTQVHQIVERLLVLTEAHLFDGEQKLQSLDQKLSQLEMRFTLNRSSP